MQSFRRCLRLSPANSAVHYLLPSHCSSTSAPSPFMVDYLARSVGLSEQEAAAASKPISDIDSPQNPDSVLEYFRSVGFSESHIRDLILLQPKVLACRVDKALVPKFQLLQELGLYGSDLADFLLKNRCLVKKKFSSGDLGPVINYLRSLFSDEQVVFVLQRSGKLFVGGAQRLSDNISTIQKRGVPEQMWRRFLLTRPRLFFLKPELLYSLMDRLEMELGIPPHSGSFLPGVNVLSSHLAALESKAVVFESFGWCKSDYMALFRNQPNCFSYSETRIRKILEFLIGEVDLDPSYITSHSSLLTRSLDKRLAPRYKYLSALKSKDLVGAKPGFYTVVTLTEKVFVKRYLDKFKLKAPDVYEAYINSTSRLEGKNC